MSNDFNLGKGKYWQRSLQLTDGCTPVSVGCDNCWSAVMTHRFKEGLTDKGKFNGKIEVREDRLDLPLKTKKPTVFSVWNDFCHPHIPIDFQCLALTKMRYCTQHIFLILTKRPEALTKLWSAEGYFNQGDSLPNVFFGTSIENQQTADERIPHLLQIPGKKFLSIEPMLGETDISGWLPQIDQVICGSESGHNKRPTNIEWIENLVEQCTVATIPLFIKQIDINGKTSKDMNDWPDKLRRRDLIWKI